MKTKAEATKVAKAAIKKMRTKGWKVRVWENCGWHASIFRGFLHIHYDEYLKTYSALMGADASCPGGEMYWSHHFRHKDPNKVEIHQLNVAIRFTHKCANAIGVSMGEAK